jgi:CRP/FNR family cyclic AMP-dependent transcriptional regulator
MDLPETSTSSRLQTGKVKLTVVSKTGKEATIGIFERWELFRRRFTGWPTSSYGFGSGNDRLCGDANRQEGHGYALHREHELSDLFVTYLLARNVRYEEDLVDQLFNSS